MSQSTRVLIITPHYAPDFGPSAPIFTALCEDLQEKGYDITVVAGFPHYLGTDHIQNSRKLFQEERQNGVRIIRTFVYAVQKNALWKRLLYHGTFNIFSALAALRVGKPDVVLANAPSLWSGLPLITLTIMQKIPFVYMVFDIYPDVLVRLGVFRHQGLINLMDRIERFFYKQSSHTSVLSEGFKKNLLRKGVPEDKIVIIPPCVDTEFIRPLARENELRDRWELNGKFVVLYAGNIGYSQGLDNVLDAAESLQDYPDIAFVFIGGGATKPALQTMAEEKRLNNVKFFPFQPREYVPFVYALADISLVSLKPDIIVESVPSKTYTIMASARPIVATVAQTTEVGRLLDQSQCGICIEPGNAKALVEKILELYEDENLRIEMGKRGREFVLDHFSRKVISNQYHKLIQQIVNKDEQQ